MKKFTLIAACAAVAMSAAAQYTTENVGTAATLAANNGKTVYGIYIGNPEVTEALGERYVDLGPNEETRFLYVWENTTEWGTAMGPGADGGEYMSPVATGETWFGSGYNINKGANVDLSALNTKGGRFHMAFKTDNKCPGIEFTVANDDETGSKLSFVIGKDYSGDLNVLGDFSDEWQAIDVPVADFGKISPATWNAEGLNSFTGNIFAFNQGTTYYAGETFAYDSVFFYTTEEGGDEPDTPDTPDTPEDPEDALNTVKADNFNFYVHGKVIEVLGTNGIQLFNLNGQLVKSTNGAALDANNVGSGVYVVRAGNNAAKVVL